MVAGAELLLAPGQTDGQASPGGLLAGVRYLGHGGRHPASHADFHLAPPCGFLLVVKLSAVIIAN